jgi:hypothetical protein
MILCLFVHLSVKNEEKRNLLRTFGKMNLTLTKQWLVMLYWPTNKTSLQWKNSLFDNRSMNIKIRGENEPSLLSSNEFLSLETNSIPSILPSSFETFFTA